MYVWCVEGIDVCMVCGGYTCMCGGVWRVYTCTYILCIHTCIQVTNKVLYVIMYSHMCVVEHSRYLRSGRAWLMVPLVPLTFVVGYQLDMAFGNKMDRVIGKIMCVCSCTVGHNLVYTHVQLDIALCTLMYSWT